VEPFNPDFKFTIDGREIRYVRSVQIEAGMDGPPIVHVEFIAHVRGKIRGIVKGKAMRIEATS